MSDLRSSTESQRRTTPSSDFISFLRFRPRSFSLPPSEADAIVLLMPGLLCGANALLHLGRQVVYMAKTMKGMNIEVWGTQRRSNALEDLTGINEAERMRDTSVAIDYYFHGAPVGGKVFAGFLADPQVPFLSEFGLELAMNDIYKIITTMLPHRNTSRAKLFVGGHSLGGVLTAVFGGWDFDGDPETIGDAGFMNCAGFIGLDSVVSTGGFELDLMLESLPEGFQENPSDITEVLYTNTVEAIRHGSAPGFLLYPGLHPRQC